MRKWIARALLMGLVALPSAVQAQYPSTGYYYAQPQRYYAPVPYYPQVQYPQGGYYNPQPMPQYVPMPAYIPQVQPASLQDRAVASSSDVQELVPSAQPVTLPDRAAPQTPPIQNAVPQNLPGPMILPDVSIAPTEVVPGANSKPSKTAPVATSAKPRVTLTSIGKAPPAAPIAKEPSESIAAPIFGTEVCERKSCRLFVFGDYLYWTVHGADVPFAQAFDGIDPLLSVPRGPVGIVSPQFNSGFRAGGGVAVSDCSWIVGTFTYFRTDKTANLAAPDGLVLRNFLAFPNTASSAVDSLTSTIDYRIQLMMGDIDYKYAIVNNDRFFLNWLAGVRYAHLDQDLSNTFQVTGSTTVDSHINFDGIGPRFGLEGKSFCRGGLFGYANGIVDVLFGQFRASSQEQNTFTGLVGQTSITTNRVVPILEFELGAGWQSPNGRIRLSGGYYVGAWFNTMTMTSLSSGIGAANFTTNGNNFRDNMIFDGFVGRFEFRF